MEILKSAKPVSGGDPCRLISRQALVNDCVFLMEDQIFEVDLWPRMSN
jgi:hypothetical protein